MNLPSPRAVRDAPATPVVRPPHRPLPASYRDAAGRRAFPQHTFDETAPDHEHLERVLALGSGAWYRRRALERAGLAAVGQMLDLSIFCEYAARGPG